VITDLVPLFNVVLLFNAVLRFDVAVEGRLSR